MLLQNISSLTYELKRKVATTGSCQQIMFAISEIQNPHHSFLKSTAIVVLSKRAVKSPLSKLRFAAGVIADRNIVLFQRHNMSVTTSNDSARESGLIKSRLSADVWYSGNSPLGVRIRQPIGKLIPGEQNCRSSYPKGENGRISHFKPD